MMAHSISDMENYFSELEDFITLSDNDKVHLFHSSMLEILILKVFFYSISFIWQVSMSSPRPKSFAWIQRIFSVLLDL